MKKLNFVALKDVGFKEKAKDACCVEHRIKGGRWVEASTILFDPPCRPNGFLLCGKGDHAPLKKLFVSSVYGMHDEAKHSLDFTKTIFPNDCLDAMINVLSVFFMNKVKSPVVNCCINTIRIVQIASISAGRSIGHKIR